MSNTVTSIANTSELRDYIRRIENLEQEKAERTEDIKEVYNEAKSSGFDTKIMRKIVRLRRMDDAERTEEETLLDLYMEALGMKLEVR